MKTLFETISGTFLSWSESVLRVPVQIGLSRTAVLSSSAFVRTGAKDAAGALLARLHEFQLYGAEVFRCVEERNGWLLFVPDTGLLDAYALSLPGPRPGEGIRSDKAELVDYRMDMLLRHPDSALPDYTPVVRAVLTASYASARGRWTGEDARQVLSMLHGLGGKERLDAEQRCARAAKIILFERMQMRAWTEHGTAKGGKTYEDPRE